MAGALGFPADYHLNELVRWENILHCFGGWEGALRQKGRKQKRTELDTALSQLSKKVRIPLEVANSLHPFPMHGGSGCLKMPVPKGTSRADLNLLTFDLNSYMEKIQQELLLKMAEGEWALSVLEVTEESYKACFDKHFYKVAPFVTKTYQCVLPGCLESARLLELAHLSRFRAKHEVQRLAATAATRKNPDVVKIQSCREAFERLKQSEDEFHHKFEKDRKELEDALRQLDENDEEGEHPDSINTQSCREAFEQLKLSVNAFRQKVMKEREEVENELSQFAEEDTAEACGYPDGVKNQSCRDVEQLKLSEDEFHPKFEKIQEELEDALRRLTEKDTAEACEYPDGVKTQSCRDDVVQLKLSEDEFHPKFEKEQKLEDVLRRLAEKDTAEACEYPDGVKTQSCRDDVVQLKLSEDEFHPKFEKEQKLEDVLRRLAEKDTAEACEYPDGVKTQSCRDDVVQLKLSEDEFHPKFEKEQKLEDVLRRLAEKDTAEACEYPGGVKTQSCRDDVEQLKLSEDKFHPKFEKEQEELEDALRRLAEKARLSPEDADTLHPDPMNASDYPHFPVVTRDSREDMIRLFFDLNSFIREIRQRLLNKMVDGECALTELEVTENIYKAYFRKHFNKVAPFVTKTYQCVLPGCLEDARLLELALLSRLRTSNELHRSAMAEARGYPEDRHYWEGWEDAVLQKVRKQREELDAALTRLAEKDGLSPKEAAPLHPDPMNVPTYPHIPVVRSETIEEMIRLFFDLNYFMQEMHQRLLLKMKEGENALYLSKVTEDVYKSYFDGYFYEVAPFISKLYHCVLPGCLESARLLELAHLSRLRTKHELGRLALVEQGKYTHSAKTQSRGDAVELLKLSEDEFHDKVVKEREELEDSLCQLAKKARLSPEQAVTLHPDPMNVPTYPEFPMAKSECKEDMIQLFFDLKFVKREVRQRLLLKMVEGEKALSRLGIPENIYKYYFDWHFYKLAPFVTKTYQCVLPGCLEDARLLELAHLSSWRTNHELQRSAMPEAPKYPESVKNSPCREAVEQLKLSKEKFRQKVTKEREDMDIALSQLAEKARISSKETESLHLDPLYEPADSYMPKVTSGTRQDLMLLFLDLNYFARKVRHRLLREIETGRDKLSHFGVAEHIYKSYFDDHFYRVVPFVAQVYQCVLPDCMDSARLLELALLSKLRTIDRLQTLSGKPRKIFPAIDVSEDPSCMRHSPYNKFNAPDENVEARMFLDWIRRGGSFCSPPELHSTHTANEINMEVVNTRIRILEEAITGAADERSISGWLDGNFTVQSSEESKQVFSDYKSSHPLDSKLFKLDPSVRKGRGSASSIDSSTDPSVSETSTTIDSMDEMEEHRIGGNKYNPFALTDLSLKRNRRLHRMLC